MTDIKKLSERSIMIYKSMDDLGCFDKRDLVAILGTLIELDVRRAVEKRPTQEPK